MSSSNYTDQQVDDYIMDRLVDKEKVVFEEALKSDSNLEDHVASRRLLISGIEAFHSKKMKQQLKNIHHQNFGESTNNSVKSQRKILPWISIAAAIALLLGAFLWFNNSTATSDDLFANHFSPYELSFAQRSTSDKELLQLEDAYNREAFEVAIPLFEKNLQSEKNSPKFLLGLGISRLALHQNEKALKSFDDILKSGDVLYKDHAIWYAALAYIKMDDYNKAKELLTQLTQDVNSDHYKEAVVLLKEF